MEKELEVEQTYMKSRESIREEVELAIKVGKSPVCDLVTAEMITASREQGIDVYHHLCKKIWHQGK